MQQQGKGGMTGKESEVILATGSADNSASRWNLQLALTLAKNNVTAIQPGRVDSCDEELRNRVQLKQRGSGPLCRAKILKSVMTSPHSFQ
jgi:hypothetical protein